MTSGHWCLVGSRERHRHFSPNSFRLTCIPRFGQDITTDLEAECGHPYHPLAGQPNTGHHSFAGRRSTLVMGVCVSVCVC
jgi:hypothetical protein